MIEIAIERVAIEIGAHPARILQQRQRRAIVAGAAVARFKRMRDKAEAVGLKSAAERQQGAVDIAATAFGIGRDVGQKREPRRHISRRSRDGGRCGEQRPLAGGLDIVAGKPIETGERRSRRQRPDIQFRRAGLERAPLHAQIANVFAVEEGPGQSRAQQRADDHNADARHGAGPRPVDRKRADENQERCRTGSNPQPKRRTADVGIKAEHQSPPPNPRRSSLRYSSPRYSSPRYLRPLHSSPQSSRPLPSSRAKPAPPRAAFACSSAIAESLAAKLWRRRGAAASTSLAIKRKLAFLGYALERLAG